MLLSIYEFHSPMEKEPLPRKIFSKQEARLKAASYCAYQERSQYEVRNKLYEWGLYPQDIELIISELIEQNFLNEKRFAFTYTLGKFRIKGWGKIKIKQGLKLKQIPEKLISKALLKIDGNDYVEKLEQIIDKKELTLTEKDPYKRRYKLMLFAAMKGYERDLIADILNNNKLT